MNGVFNQLSNALHASIETGNPEAAELSIKMAQEALEDGLIALPDMAELQSDFDTHFQ